MAPAIESGTASDLKLVGISKSFNGVAALTDTSLVVPQGKLVALLGPSGCGKSTTLRIIAGFESPDTGEVRIGGRDILDLPPNRRGLGMVFQDYSLFPHMTVIENVGFGLRMTGVSRPEITRRAREILDLVRLIGMDDRFPRQLSGGQQQRVALARSLVTRPSLLLLDEPLGALDKNLRESMQFELRRIQQSLNITTVLVTHDQEEALTLSDQVAVMNKGRILQIGTPHDVYESPSSRFVAEFLGATNFLSGRFGGVEDGLSVIRVGPDGSGQTVRAPVAPDLPASADVLVGVRPEKTNLSAEPSGAGNAVRGRVVGHVFRGTSHAYEISIGGDLPLFQVFQQASARDGQMTFGPGTDVWVNWRPADSFTFANADEQ